MRRLVWLLVLLVCTAPAHAAVLFEGTFSGVVTERYFGPDVWAYDEYGDPIPGFSADTFTSAELGLPGFIDPGDSFTGSIALTQDDSSGGYFLNCGLPFSYCGSVYVNSLVRDPITNRVTSFEVGTGPDFWGGSIVTIWDGGGHYYYEDDAEYGGTLPGGGYWESYWGLRVNMSLGPITRTDIPSVPVPATALLLAGGVGFLGAAARRRPAR